MGTLAYRRSQSSLTGAGTKQVRPVYQDGVPQSTPLIFKPFRVTVASIGTPATIWNPPTGSRFRVLGYTISGTAADYAIFRESGVASGGFQFNTAQGAINAVQNSPELWNGLLGASLNTALVLDTGVAGTTWTGTVFGTEEPV